MPLSIFPSNTLANSTYGQETVPYASEAHTVTTANSATVLTPPGFYYVVNGAQNSVQYTPNAGGTYRTLIAASAGGMVWSDGVTVQITNTSTGGTSAFYAQVLGPV